MNNPTSPPPTQLDWATRVDDWLARTAETDPNTDLLQTLDEAHALLTEARRNQAQGREA